MTDKLESEKDELVLGLNPFQKPEVLHGKEAWVREIQNLLFLRPGTYPSCPNMGIGIQDFEFSFIDSAVDELQMRIPAQVSNFLPTVPFRGCSVYSKDIDGRPVLFVILKFTDMTKESGEDTAVMATLVAHNMIDFEISL